MTVRCTVHPTHSRFGREGHRGRRHEAIFRISVSPCYSNQLVRSAISLSGPIGVGKTTLGQALAGRLSAGFIDGDNLSDPDRPWYCSILQTSKGIVQSGLEMLRSTPAVVIAYPLGCINWIYFRKKFEDAGAKPLFVTLRASFPSIVDGGRGRTFSSVERDRIQVMIAEGYGSRLFSDLVLDTDQADFAGTLAQLERETRRMITA